MAVNDTHCGRPGSGGLDGNLAMASASPSASRLHSAVRRALCPHGLSAAILASLAATTAAATAAPFPALFQFAKLLPAGSGDGSDGFVAVGAGFPSGSTSGTAVGGAGDVNGDGIADIVIGANTLGFTEWEPGAAFVLFGTSRGFAPLFPLVELFPVAGGDGSRGFVLTGINDVDRTGSAVSGAGDVNGDGIGDLIVAGLFSDQGRREYAGESYVVFGSGGGFPPVLSLARLFPGAGGDGSLGFVLPGAGPDDQSGRDVAAAGDVNGDGLDDLIIGTRFGTPGTLDRAGESYVVFGSTQRFPAVFPLGTLLPENGGDGSRGFVMAGSTENDHAGSAVDGAGDVNGDGISDLIVGAEGADLGGFGSGAAYVVFGTASGFPALFELSSLLPDGGGDGSAGVAFIGIDEGNYTGKSVNMADINGDGLDDLIMGAPFAKLDRRDDTGETVVVFGRTDFPAVFELASLLPVNGGDGSRGFVLPGIGRDDLSGYETGSAGDLNGDGIEDLVIGAPSADAGGLYNIGETYVVFGSTQPFPAVLPLAKLWPGAGGDGTRGFVMTGVGQFVYSGSEVSSAGDVNDDGVDDLMVSSFRANPGGQTYVVFGRRTDN